MKIRLLLFASLREAAGTGELEIEIEGTRAGEALDQLRAHIPAIEPFLDRIHLAVNEEYANRDTPIHEGDTLALIPPVSGGKP